MIYDKIFKIEELDIQEAIDIEVSGDHLFYANDILTHNSNSDVELTDTSESFGLPATADLMFALISTEELENLGQLLVKQLKNRYDDINKLKRFVIGVERAKMRLFDLDTTAQKNLLKLEEHNEPRKPNVVSSKLLNKRFDNIKV